MKRNKQRFAVIDFETDPFQYGESVTPFVAGYFDGENFNHFWGDDCLSQLYAFLESVTESHYIFAHNGGKFDFVFLLRAGLLKNPLKIISGRIVSAKLSRHTLRDSFAIIPVPLAAWCKDKFEYSKLTKKNRNRYRTEILQYLESDCKNLHSMVSRYIEEYGIRLTAASAAFSMLKKTAHQESANKTFDERFRPYYFGGRVECFETGIIKSDFKLLDVNSMYPHVMRNFLHPKGTLFLNVSRKPDADGHLKGALHNSVYFAEIEADSNGALPVRSKEGLSFPHVKGERFFACSHEIQVGIRNGLLNVKKWHAIAAWRDTQDFAAFVDPLYSQRQQAKRDGNDAKSLFSKIMLNSAYGKFALNPENYKDYVILPWDEQPPEGREWTRAACYENVALWESKSDKTAHYNNVAIAASITSAARSVLLDAVVAADRPIYCDTDSLICKDAPLDMDQEALGAWKTEAIADKAAIAGKKLYALFNGEQCVKLASKGVRLTPDQILRVCNGESVTWKKESPSMGLSGDKWIERKISIGQSSALSFSTTIHHENVHAHIRNLA